MNDSPRSGFSLRDFLAQIRRRFPWPPTTPPVVRPESPAIKAARVRAQFAVIERALGDQDGVAMAGPEGPEQSTDPANCKYLFRPGHALVRDNTDDKRYFDEFLRFFEGRADDFDGPPTRDDSRRLPIGLVSVRMPNRRDEGDAVLRTLEEVDDDRRRRGDPDPVAQPDHVLYVTPKGLYCPATEPAVPRVGTPLPPVNRVTETGLGVRVSVVDTGWWKASASHPATKRWMHDVTSDPEDEEQLKNGTTIEEYGGHGTFVAGVIKCLAPGARVEIEGALPKGGAVYESDICEQIKQALDEDDLPQLISISAGTYTWKNMGLLGFEMLMATFGLDGVRTIVVAAAGNDETDDPFYPAAYSWVVGVGSVDSDKARSTFSNFGKSVDVYARGRDLVNAFPVGEYVTHYPENMPNGVGEVRKFDGLAQWSGTSFAAPMVTGAIAAQMTATGNLTDPTKAYKELLQAAPSGPDGKKVIGPL